MEDKYTNTNIHNDCREFLLGSSPPSPIKEKYSSNLNVDPDIPPAFIAVGDKDNTISIANSYSYVEALTKNEVDNTLIIAPNGDHGYMEWSNLTPIRQTLREWLTKQISQDTSSAI